jgi:hypothetical protein
LNAGLITQCSIEEKTATWAQNEKFFLALEEFLSRLATTTSNVPAAVLVDENGS